MRKPSFLVLLTVALVAAAAEVVDFALPDLRGNVHHLSDYRGKWVVVNYWATWCPPCLEEIPELVRFHEKHKGTDAVVLGVNFEDVDPDYLNDFVESYLISYPVLRAQGRDAMLGPIPGMPTTYLVSPDGEVIARNVGPVTGATLEKFIEGLTRGQDSSATLLRERYTGG